MQNVPTFCIAASKKKQAFAVFSAFSGSIKGHRKKKKSLKNFNISEKIQRRYTFSDFSQDNITPPSPLTT
jgi:hypothetical protein